MNNKIKQFIKEKRTDIIAVAITAALVAILCVALVLEARAAYKQNDDLIDWVVVVEYADSETDGESETMEPEVTEEPETTVPVIEETTPAPETEYIIPESKYYDIPLSTSVQDHIFKVSEEYGVDPRIVIAMIEYESDYDASTVGDQGRSFGLMQVQARWHKERMERLGVTDLLNPYENITVGVDYLASLIDLNNSLEWALMAYNGGPAYAYSKSAKGILTEYVTEVISNSNNLVKG